MSNLNRPNVLLVDDLIELNAHPTTKDEAIKQVGELLIRKGVVSDGFIESMKGREAASNTFLGTGIAIPHGQGSDKNLINDDAIAILQVPAGVEWGQDQPVKLVVAIAAKSDTHITILRKLTRLLQNDSLIQELITTSDKNLIINTLMGDAPAQETNDLVEAKDLQESFEWTIDYPAGLHARPSSAWSVAASSLGAKVQVRHKNEIASADNMIELLQLGLKEGDKIIVSTDATNGAKLLSDFKAVIRGLSADEKAQAEEAKRKEQGENIGGWKPVEHNNDALRGVSGSPGFFIGKIYQFSNETPKVEDNPIILTEGAKILENAFKASQDSLEKLIEETTAKLSSKDAKIFEAQLSLLSDKSMLNEACRLMANGHGVAWSWYQSFEQKATELANSTNAILAERAADLRDVGYRVLGNIDPVLKKQSLSDIPDGEWILATSDLSPSDTALLDTDKIKGLVTAVGGATSHTAILARTLGIPAVTTVGNNLYKIPEGQEVILDADAGCLYATISEENRKSAIVWANKLKEQQESEIKTRLEPATTLDGQNIVVAANINHPKDISDALSNGAEGVGLMRTEFLFIEGNSSPTEEEQYIIYRDMVENLEGRQLIVRTLDIGGDKKVEHLNLPHEENPFLGVRGSRLLLRRLDLLLPQIRALYRVAKDGGKLSIMFSMITSLAELHALKHYCEEVRQSLDAPSVPLGIMIEVPAAAVMADIFAEHVDFFSIGTNDLTQYTLAIDRQNPELASEANALHPAVLRLIQKTVEGAKKYDRHVGVCGGLAGDPLGAVLLMGIGVDELSMTVRDIAPVKARIRTNSLEQMKEVAAKALTMQSDANVKALMKELS